jgi:hypothetical protein
MALKYNISNLTNLCASPAMTGSKKRVAGKLNKEFESKICSFQWMIYLPESILR